MDKNNSHMVGYGLAAASAITFSAKGIFAKILYGYGIDPITLLALRFIIAMPFFWLTLWFYPSGKVDLRDMAVLVISGLLGLYGAALTDFYGLLYIDASLERVILYTYPAIVVIWTYLFFKEKLGRRKLISIGLTYVGLAFALKIFSGGKGINFFGAGLVLFSAIIYSLSYIITEVLSRRVSGVKISAYTTTAAGFAFIGTWHGKYVPTDPHVWGLIFVLAVFSTYIPVLTLALGIKRIGASRAALVSFIGPVSTAILAYVFLNETMELIQIIGMGLVIIGVLVIYSEKNGKKGGEKAAI
ncbi:MAG: DMT family transporter [Deltaproteobacteria bacterium]|nr:DMT family transporter [Deltaproteobacteria bacterium]